MSEIPTLDLDLYSNLRQCFPAELGPPNPRMSVCLKVLEQDFGPVTNRLFDLLAEAPSLELLLASAFVCPRLM